MPAPERKYPGKLLILGEYTVLLGSSAIAIPFPQFDGRWVARSEKRNLWLVDFGNYLKANCGDFLDLSQLEELVANCSFELTIPIGYGLGSSGALTAGIYDKCAIEKSQDLRVLQDQLGRIESYFHGQSSGFDPLVSYLNKSILRKADGTISMIDISTNKLLSKFELVDSGQPRSDKKELIPAFVKMSGAQGEVVKELVSYNDMAISALLSNNETLLLKSIKSISQWQYQHMRDWITPEIADHWHSNDNYAFKICGAGGGGYYLRFRIND